MDFKLGVLYNWIEFIDKQLLVYCFSPPPFSGHSTKYKDFLQTSLISSLEEEIEQNKKFYKKKLPTSFVDGRKEYLNNIISTIANVVCLTKFILEPNDYPIIITYLMDIANILSSPNFKI